jgi:signal transduction histidine kinase
MEAQSDSAALAKLLPAELLRERLQSAGRINALRLVGVSSFFALFLVLGGWLRIPAWQGNLGLFCAYWLLALASWFISRRRSSFARFSTLAIAAVDVPVVYLLQRATLATSPSASGVAGFTIGVFVLLVALCALSLDRRQIFGTAAVAALFEILLQREAGVGQGAMVATVLVLGLSAGACSYASARLNALIARMVAAVGERELIRARLIATDRMASLGTLAAGVAHEINNPLAYSVMSLELLERRLEKDADPSELKSELANANLGLSRVRNIVKDLKTFSRIEDEERRLVDVRGLLDQAINMAWHEIRYRAKVERDYADAPAVQANETRLGQVFLNLLINAAQAIAEGRPDENRVRVAVHPEGPNVIVEISDTGCGIEPSVQSHIFEPFFTTKPAGVGTGLGLSICYGIVQALGGDIRVDSQVGKGSTFRVTLPIGA